MTAIQISRRELFDRAWSKPMTANAAELGTMPTTLSAFARQFGLPLPRAGHWVQREMGKEVPTPDYPADPALDAKLYAIPAPSAATLNPATAEEIGVSEHKRVASTRNAIQKSRSPDRASIRGRGKFRLFVSPACGERACEILDRLVAAAEAKGWSFENTEQGHAVVADGETVDFMIEEKLDRVPHVVTAAELKEKAEYDRKCELADRGIGHRPWRRPSIPEHDHVPNGELVLKFDQNYAANGVRRSFSDGKRQRLEGLVPSVIEALERWAAAVKARRERDAEQEREYAEEKSRRKERERQARVEGYRITFLQRQIERKREIDGLSSLIATWQGAEDINPKFAELVEFAQFYRQSLEAKIAPTAIAERIAALNLMDDDVLIYDAKRLD